MTFFLLAFGLDLGFLGGDGSEDESGVAIIFCWILDFCNLLVVGGFCGWDTTGCCV